MRRSGRGEQRYGRERKDERKGKERGMKVSNRDVRKERGKQMKKEGRKEKGGMQTSN